MRTNYYTLNNGQWVESKLNDVNIGWRWIKLYDDNLNLIGIGMYPKSK